MAEEQEPHLKVVPLYESNARTDIPATLRLIADQIEEGKYGDVGEVAMVLLGDTMEVFGMGPESDACSSGMLLHAGFLRFSQVLEQHGVED